MVTTVAQDGEKSRVPGSVSILAVFGYPHGRGSGRAVALAPRGGGDSVEWEALLRSRPNEPTWIVCDQAKAVVAAVWKAWPDATIYVCEAHLRMLAEKRLAADGFDRSSALWKALPGEIGNRDRWEQLEADAHAADARSRRRRWRSGGDKRRPETRELAGARRDPSYACRIHGPSRRTNTTRRATP